YAAVAVAVGAIMLGLIFWRWGNTDPMWAIAAFVRVYDPDTRVAYDSGISRMLYTLLGCALSVGAIHLFGLHKWLLPVCLGMTMFLCGYFFSFKGAWRALLVCVALVVGSSLMEPTADLQ